MESTASDATTFVAAAGIVGIISATAGLSAMSPDHQSGLRTSIPVSLTSNVDISVAEAFLSSSDGTMPNGFATASSLLFDGYSDSQLVFNGSAAGLATLSWYQMADLAWTGQLDEGALENGTNYLAASGDIVPATSPTTDVNVNGDTNASQYFTGVINEANIETASLQNLHDLLDSQVPHPELGLTDEVGLTGDLMLFQEQINGASNALNQALPSFDGYETDGFLDAMLKGLLVSELNMNNLSGDAATQFGDGDVTALAGTDAAMLTNALGEYSYMQAALGFFSFENALQDAGSWFSSLF